MPSNRLFDSKTGCTTANYDSWIRTAQAAYNASNNDAYVVGRGQSLDEHFIGKQTKANADYWQTVRGLLDRGMKLDDAKSFVETRLGLTQNGKVDIKPAAPAKRKRNDKKAKR